MCIRDSFSEEAKNILKRLLCVDPLHRLGSSEQDAEEIKADPFFRSINWKELEGRRTQPPFKPEVKSKEDCQNVDRLFLKEAPVDTPTTGMRIAGPGDVNYDGFTYARQEMSIKNDGLNI
eukprot:TRINITY_DN4286_c0_g1_i14.p1 TRINITY_DN4286_c0_g1~~TRINITY_DN4286_c0_g1_i14.p1  ORF type:complete len:135 (-),score=39.89 TRINITY_DN4286_c0_g1_i14:167-526(-)